jgi:hypothetical protein
MFCSSIVISFVLLGKPKRMEVLFWKAKKLQTAMSIFLLSMLAKSVVQRY